MRGDSRLQMLLASWKFSWIHVSERFQCLVPLALKLLPFPLCLPAGLESKHTSRWGQARDLNEACTDLFAAQESPTQLINNEWLACRFFCFSTTAPSTPIWARSVPGRIWSAINGTTRSQLDATRGLCPHRPLRLRWRRRSVCWLERPTAADQSHNIVPLAAQRRRSGIVVSLHFHKSCQCGWRWDNSFGFLVAPRPQRVSVCPLQLLHYCPFQIFIFHLHLQWSSLALSEPLLNLAYVKFSPLLEAFCVQNARVSLRRKNKTV